MTYKASPVSWISKKGCSISCQNSLKQEFSGPPFIYSYYINGDVCLLTGRRVESQDLEMEENIEYPRHAFRQIYVKFCVENSILVLLQAVRCDILTYRMWTLE